MPKGHVPHELSERMRNALANEHAGICDYIEELKPYVRHNPDDNWASGQLRYFIHRKKQLEIKLGNAKNRAKR